MAESLTKLGKYDLLQILGKGAMGTVYEGFDPIIARRLAIAHEELSFVRNFDYLVINEDAHPDAAISDLEAIVHAERLAIYRYSDYRLKEIEQS